jgi:uncharacterized membrane protein YgcG
MRAIFLFIWFAVRVDVGYGDDSACSMYDMLVTISVGSKLQGCFDGGSGFDIMNAFQDFTAVDWSRVVGNLTQSDLMRCVNICDDDDAEGNNDDDDVLSDIVDVDGVCMEQVSCFVGELIVLNKQLADLDDDFLAANQQLVEDAVAIASSYCDCYSLLEDVPPGCVSALADLLGLGDDADAIPLDLMIDVGDTVCPTLADGCAYGTKFLDQCFDSGGGPAMEAKCEDYAEALAANEFDSDEDQLCAFASAAVVLLPPAGIELVEGVCTSAGDDDDDDNNDDDDDGGDFDAEEFELVGSTCKPFFDDVLDDLNVDDVLNNFDDFIDNTFGNDDNKDDGDDNDDNGDDYNDGAAADDDDGDENVNDDGDNDDVKDDDDDESAEVAVPSVAPSVAPTAADAVSIAVALELSAILATDDDPNSEAPNILDPTPEQIEALRGVVMDSLSLDASDIRGFNVVLKAADDNSNGGGGGGGSGGGYARAASLTMTAWVVSFSVVASPAAAGYGDAGAFANSVAEALGDPSFAVAASDALDATAVMVDSDSISAAPASSRGVVAPTTAPTAIPEVEPPSDDDDGNFKNNDDGADTEESNPYRDTSSASASLPVLILMAVILACVGGGAVWVSVKGGGCIKEEDIVDASCDDSDSDDGVGDNVIIDFRRRDGSSGGGSGGGGIGRGEETGVELADFGAPHRKKESAVTSSSRSRPAYQTVDTRGSSEEKKMSVSNPMQAGRSTTPTNDPPDGAAAAEEEDDSRWL